MTKESCVVEYGNAEFLVVGDWYEGCPDSLYEPGERAGFSDLYIYFGTDSEGNDYDIFDILSPEAQSSIIELAEIEIGEAISGRAEEEAIKESDRRRGK